MTATNHVLTGMVIATVIQQPFLALSVAFCSHFVCDSLPHFGDEKRFGLKTKAFKILLSSDCAVAAILLLEIVINQPVNWLVIVLAGILAASPDLMWFPGYLRVLHGQPRMLHPGRLMKCHSRIQWSQTPAGTIVELLWLVGVSSLLLGRL